MILELTAEVWIGQKPSAFVIPEQPLNDRFCTSLNKRDRRSYSLGLDGLTKNNWVVKRKKRD